MNKIDSINVLKYKIVDGIVLDHNIYIESMVFFLFVTAILFFIRIFSNNHRFINDYINFFTSSDSRSMFSNSFWDNHKMFFYVTSIFIYSLFTLFSCSVIFRNGIFLFKRNVYLLTLGYTFAFFLVKYLFYNWIGFTFFSKDKIKSWLSYYHQLLALSAFLLVPLVSIIYMKFSIYEKEIVLFSVSLIVLFVILLLLKTKNIFNQKGNLFYLILYLCALEIVPAIFYIKSIVSLI